jgi:hypothetical protein
VNTWGPIGLIEIAAPDDEYDHEIADLARRVIHCQRIAQQAVDAIWIRWFGDVNYGLAGSAESASFAATLGRLQVAFANG